MATLQQVVSIATSEQSAPFILKMDIEGSEANIFDGSDNPARLFPIIIIEPHDRMLPGERTSQSFFRFHLESGRDFLSRGENIFSLDFSILDKGCSIGGNDRGASIPTESPD